MADHRFAAEILRASARGLSGLAAEQLLPRITTRLGSNGADNLESWRQHLDGRLSELALALEEDRPATFLEQVAWTKLAFETRDLPVEDLRASLDCLREVVSAELPGPVGSSVAQLLEQASEGLEGLVPNVGEALAADRPHSKLAAQYMLAVLEGDRQAATQLLLDAVSAGQVSVSDALLDVVFAAQRELGRMWHTNELTIAEEHAVTATSSRIVGQLGALAKPHESTGKVVLAAALADDEHDIGLRVIAELFEIDGWRCVLVGGRLPVAELANAVERFDVDLVLLSASVDAHRRSIARAMQRLRASDGERAGVPVIVGGPAFVGREDTWDSLGADACVLDGRDAVATGRRLVGLPERDASA